MAYARHERVRSAVRLRWNMANEPPGNRQRADRIMIRFPKSLWIVVLRKTVVGLAWVSAAAVLFMMLITALDVAMRLMYRPVTGTFDMVRIAGAVAVACAIPYTTAIKGHVAIEYFFHKLGRLGRIGVDALIRSLGMALFALIAWQSVRYGLSLRASGEVTPTLQWPVFWVPYMIAFCCAVTVGVILHNLLNPGKAMIKP